MLCDFFFKENTRKKKTIKKIKLPQHMNTILLNSDKKKFYISDTI